MSNFRLVSGKLSLYFLGVAVGNLVTIFSIPILFRTLGSSLWGDLIVAQSIGMILAILIDLGYSNFAPARISQLSNIERDRFYSKSLSHRMWIFMASVICFALSQILGLTHFSAAQLTIILAYASQGLSSSWLFISRNDARGYFAKIMIPRAIFPLFGSVLTIFWSSGLLYGLFVLAGSVVSLTFNNKSLYLKRQLEGAKPRKRDYSVQGFVRYDFFNSVLNSLLLQLPVLLVATFSPALLVSFALADKIVKALAGLTWPVVALFQGSVFQDIGHTSTRVKRNENIFGFVIAIICLIIVPITCNTFVEFVAGNELRFSLTERLFIGILIYALFQNSLMASVHIVRNRRTRSLVITNTISLTFTVASLILLRNSRSLTEILLIIIIAYSMNFFIMRIIISKSNSLTNPIFP
jgi:hypothetical protein